MTTGSKQRVLVAGATGYLGGFVVKEFKSRGYYVRALARSPQKLDTLKDAIDETVIGEITDPESIKDVCEGIDVVFSSVGITKQKTRLTFRDVDYQGNMNLLQAAKLAGVKKFIYVSVLNGPQLPHLAIVKAHEDFVDELKASGMDHAVLRPTGYFSDMGEFFDMARKGRVYLFGSGNDSVNPIHGADLAVSCVDAAEYHQQEFDVGGPEVLTWREVAELAFEIQGKPVKITPVPVWMIKSAVKITKLFNRRQGELLAFMSTMMTSKVVAPATGTHTLREHYKSLSEREDYNAGKHQFRGDAQSFSSSEEAEAV